jgi:ketosteroid isomerase-like protein
MKAVLFSMVVLFATGCKSKHGNADEQTNVAIANAMFDAFNNHQWEAMAGYYAEPASFLDPSFGSAYVTKSRAEVVAKYKAMEDLFPDIHDELTGVYPSSDKVTVEFISSGKASDSLSFTLPIITVLTIKDGLIVKDATYYDNQN